MLRGPFGLVVLGAISIVIALVMFGVALTQLDTAMTTANTTTNTMTGLYDIMGIFGIVIFIAFMGVGLGSMGAGAYAAIRGAKRRSGRRYRR